MTGCCAGWDTSYLPLCHEDLDLLGWCILMSSELVLDVLVTQGSQVDGQEAVEHQDPLVHGAHRGHVSCRRRHALLAGDTCSDTALHACSTSHTSVTHGRGELFNTELCLSRKRAVFFWTGYLFTGTCLLPPAGLSREPKSSTIFCFFVFCFNMFLFICYWWRPLYHRQRKEFWSSCWIHSSRAQYSYLPLLPVFKWH